MVGIVHIKAFVDNKTKPSEVFKITKKMKNKYACFPINDNEKHLAMGGSLCNPRVVVCNIYKRDVTPTFD
jgi:hypothetical protein